MLKLNLGNPAVSSEGYANSAEIFTQDGTRLLPGDEILCLPWPLENNSVSSARIFFKLETITDERQLISVMKELYRVCCDGALVEIRSATQYYLDNSNIAGFGAREINGARLRFFDGDFRKAAAEADARCCNFMPKAEDFSFKSLGENLTISGALSQHMEQGSFASNEDLAAFLQQHPEHAFYRTFYLSVVKASDHQFALAHMDDLPRFTMRVFPEDQDQIMTPQLKARGAWKAPVSLACARLVQGMTKYHHEFNQGFHIASIGANVGWFSLLSCFFSDLAQVDAFEANPQALEMIHHNIALHDFANRIAVYPLALSDTKGEQTLFVEPSNAARSSLVVENPDAAQQMQVQVDSLDNVYLGRASSEWPELILMEATGHDQKVLNGAREMFNRGYRPLIVTEFAPRLLALRGECTYYRDLCKNLGYTAYIFDDSQAQASAQLVPVEVETLAETYENFAANKEQLQAMNLLFVPEWMDIETIRPKA